MKKVIFLTLVLLSSMLAGCTSGDDEVQVELSDEQIDDIMDEYFEDFVNNTTVTINDETSNVYYQNGSISTQSNYFIVDYTFTKSNLFPTYVEIDHMNNTFEAVYTEYNVSTNQNTNYTYQLDCMGYYLVGIATTPVSYWADSSNYWTAWANAYNDTIRGLYQSYANNVDVRFACDEDYDPDGGQTRSDEVLTILDITIPAGKGLMCENAPIIRMLDADTGMYGRAKGEPQYAGYPDQYQYDTYLAYQFDTLSYAISCTSMTLGSGSIDTTFTITAVDKLLDYGNEYRLYLVYTLMDVEDHIV